ncbi:MAG: (Fe-S)-binding protein [Nanoarchaeota archaeon]|nr:(Fe-S)-binding protein [Nanoarchaeota archaeon]
MINCNECGLCKESCPVYRIVKRESLSPRGFAIMKKKEVFHKFFYICSLCNNCNLACPYGIDLKLEENREFVAKKGQATEEMEKIIENLRQTGNPYGIQENIHQD